MKRVDFHETKELFLEIMNFTNWKFSEENNEQTILILFLNFPLPTHVKKEIVFTKQRSKCYSRS